MYEETQSVLLLLYHFVGFVLEGCNKLKILNKYCSKEFKGNKR